MVVLLFKDFKAFLARFESFYFNSGKKLNDLGNYHACNLAPNMTYSTGYANLPTGMAIMLGLCLNHYCTADVLNEIKFETMKFIRDIGIIDDKTAALGIVPRFEAPDVKPDKDFGYVFTIILIVVLICLSLVLPLTQLYRKFANPLPRQEAALPDRQEQSSTAITVPQAGEKAPAKNAEKIPAQWLFESFSLTTNFAKYKEIRQLNPELLIYNSIRFFSFLEVVLGHAYILSILGLSNDFTYIEQVAYKSSFWTFTYSELLAVDMFFFLGGLFLAYTQLDPKKLKSFNYFKPLSLLMSLIHRLIRIWPALFVALMIFWKLTGFMGSGPIWGSYISATKLCDSQYNGWWLRLLFVDNLTDNIMGQQCFAWGWYLSVDMQIFWVSILILAFYYHSATLAKLLAYAALLGTTIGTICFCYQKKLGVLYFFNQNINMFSDFYIKPWFRAPPYLVGIIFGIHYREYQNEKAQKTHKFLFSKISLCLKSTPWLKWMTYLVALVLINLFVWLPKQLFVHGATYWVQWLQYWWNGTFRALYCLGVGLLCLPCMVGCKDWLIQGLSSNIFTFLAKTTYTGYLIHFMILQVALYNTGQLFMYSYTTLFTLYFYALIFTMISAALLHLFVELPFGNLDSLLQGALGRLVGKKGGEHQPAKSQLVDAQQEQQKLLGSQGEKLESQVTSVGVPASQLQPAEKTPEQVDQPRLQDS